MAITVKLNKSHKSIKSICVNVVIATVLYNLVSTANMDIYHGNQFIRNGYQFFD